MGGYEIMKYKIEIWRYNILRTEEALEHLNQMAKKGYKLVDVAASGFPRLAYYEKIKPTDEKLYSVIALCKDAKGEEMQELINSRGWKKICHLYDGLCVFEKNSEDAKIIFTDEESLKENLISTAKTSTYTLIQGYLGIGSILVYLFNLSLRAWSLKFALYSSPALILGMMLVFNLMLEYLTLKKEKNFAVMGLKYKRAAWIDKYHKLIDLIIYIYFISMIVGRFISPLDSTTPFLSIAYKVYTACMLVALTIIILRMRMLQDTRKISKHMDLASELGLILILF